jgi:hypothetical protein
MRAIRQALLLAATSLAACSPDLRESFGPRVPVPNVTGMVVRAGAPAADRKVKLVETVTDSTRASDRTDVAGRYFLTGVGAGDWTIEASSNDPTDFASVTYRFLFVSADTTLEVPDLDLSLRGFEWKKPEHDREPLPGFLSPLAFEWEPSDVPGLTVQVRVYDADYRPLWFSEKLASRKVNWNGFGNQGEYVGRPVQPGTIRVRLRLEPDDGEEEYSTAYRSFVLEREGQP